jgi:beta-lactam-binding protein with PASTA domain
VTVARRIRGLAVIALVVAAPAGCGGGDSHGHKVPKVVGQSLVQAASKLSQAQYQVRITIVRGKPPRHTVLKQDPGGGSDAKPGSKVRLEVSDGVK